MPKKILELTDFETGVLEALLVRKQQAEFELNKYLQQIMTKNSFNPKLYEGMPQIDLELKMKKMIITHSAIMRLHDRIPKN